MADNVKVLPATEAAAIDVATDEVSSVHYPVYKLAFGADGTATLLSADNPIPVTIPADVEMRIAIQRVEKQLMLMNLHLSQLSGLQIDKSDL